MVKSKVALARKNVKKISPTKSKAMKELQKTMEVGKEPKFHGDPETKEYRNFLIQYFNWANLMFEPIDLKSHFVEFFKANDYNHSCITHINPAYFNKLGKISYLINTNAPISDQIQSSFDNAVIELIDVWQNTEENEKEEIEDENKIDARTKSIMKYMSLYNDIDKVMKDEDIKTKVLKIITDNKPPLNIIQMLHNHYSEDNEQYTMEISQKRLPKAYKENISKYKTSTDEIIDVLNAQMNVAKIVKQTTRKPRKKKVVPATKLVEKLTYLKQEDSLGMVSINPESIVGASGLLVFNTKTRKFGMFSSLEGGLSVKGTTIINFDETKSLCKTLRKPQEQLNELISGTKKKTERIFNDIKAVETSLKGRINNDILILKIFK